MEIPIPLKMVSILKQGPGGFIASRASNAVLMVSWFQTWTAHRSNSIRADGIPAVPRDLFVYMPSQWETMLHCNVVSYWLGPCTKWSLVPMIRATNSLGNTVEIICYIIQNFSTFLLPNFRYFSQILENMQRTNFDLWMYPIFAALTQLQVIFVMAGCMFDRIVDLSSFIMDLTWDSQWNMVEYGYFHYSEVVSRMIYTLSYDTGFYAGDFFHASWLNSNKGDKTHRGLKLRS